MAARLPRKAMSAEVPVAKSVTSADLGGSGKLNPGKPGDLEPIEESSVDTKLYVPIAKANDDEQTITGVVLQPEIVDGQGDIIGADVIRKAAHNFLANYNAGTKLGLMHKDFKPRFQLYESYITPLDIVINSVLVKAGSWVMVVKVLDKKIWQKIKDGELAGFSIGGKARVRKLAPQGG